MLLAILLGLQILGNFLVCVESIDELGKRDVSDNEVDKRDEKEIVLSDAQLNILFGMYDKASIESYTDGNVIPDPRCHTPFDIHGTDQYWTLEIRNQHCKNDVGSTVIWCSTDITKSYTRNSGKWEHCLMKGAEVADPKKWKPHEDCVQIFTFYNRKKNKEMYYKGCINIGGDEPWCSHKYRFKKYKWSWCIDIEKRWTVWSSWSQCSQTCGGFTNRVRDCQQTGKPSAGCPGGMALEQKNCSELCPINGGWSEWSPLNNCSVTCGSGMQTKTRECNNPQPQLGGKDCGKDKEIREPCQLAECPNDQEELSKMSNRSGLSKLLFAILGSICGLILIAVVIAGVMFKKKKMQNIPVASSTTGQAGIVYQESARD